MGKGARGGCSLGPHDKKSAHGDDGGSLPSLRADATGGQRRK